MYSYIPGPWVVRWEGDAVGFKSPNRRGAMLFRDIASITLPDRDRENHIIGYEQAKEMRLANARIMAAAPELVEAAQALLAKLDNMTTDQFSKGEEREEREALRAITAKATGEVV